MSETATPFVQGKLKALIYHNDQSLYSVAKIAVEQSTEDLPEATKEVVITGHFPKLSEDESVTFYGHFHQHPRFGLQYQVERYRKESPTTEQGLVHYLSSDLFHGIGEKTAERIVAELGLQAIEKILNDDAALDAVKGLKTKKKEDLRSALKEHRGLELVLGALADYGFGPQLSIKIYQAYQERTIEMVQEFPYQLIHDVEGIGFLKADELAAKLGFTGDHPKRVEAACFYVLYEAGQNDGHTYLHEEQLRQRMAQLLRLRIEDLTSYLSTLQADKKIIKEDDKVFMAQLYWAEKGVRTQIGRLLATTESDRFSQAAFLKALGTIEEKRGITYAERQREAVETALRAQMMILTGGPGTGKTTVIRGIVEVLAKMEGFSLDPSDYKKDDPFPVLLVAPTGRAAKRMSESTSLPAMTIHRMLGWNGENKFSRDETNPVKGKLLIVDESSMLDVYLANQLLKAVEDGIKVIFVGDEDQLPSVGPGQVLKDLIQADSFPVVRLTDIYRQAESSSIIRMAHALKRGELPEDILEPTNDRRMFECSQHQLADVVVKVCGNAASKGYSPHDIQVLAPMYKGPAGIDALNLRLQECFNPPNPQKRETAHKGGILRTGDKVLQLVNRPEDHVFNGDVGEVVAIMKANETTDKQEQIVVDFDEREIVYTKQDLIQLTLAYCCSVHKSQGSEYPIVIIPLVYSYRRMLQRNLLYTAITRSKDYLILCGQLGAFNEAARRTMDFTRQTSLAYRFMDEVDSNEYFSLQEVDEPGMENVSPYDFL
ncbi:SF1B family DNA helicase RecD2 [Aureibacillus halotolerans]|nr:ATP-dependent RecD-like DNA helicase [Aureibacillus halotolerans]